MIYTQNYTSPLGKILLAADDAGLCGLWFAGQKHFADGLTDMRDGSCEPISSAERWLDLYFSGQKPEFTPPLHPIGTEFQLEVWRLLTEIPYGETTTYGALAKKLAEKRGKAGFSARAVGGAVGRNPISIIVPCHRVLGAGDDLTGYAGGLERKRFLLALERVYGSTA